MSEEGEFYVIGHRSSAFNFDGQKKQDLSQIMSNFSVPHFSFQRAITGDGDICKW